MLTAPAWLWIVFTVAGSAAQTARTAMQRELTDVLGTIGATHVRFLFGLPFGLLFLGLVALLSADPLPPINASALAWIAGGAVSQIVATALMLAAMRERSFVVATALVKIEPVWIAIAGALFLADPLTPAMLAAILVATLGVLLTSWPRPSHGGRTPSGWLGGYWGLAAGALFGFAALGYRGGIGALGGTSFVAAATLALAIALTLQTVLLTGYLALRATPARCGPSRAWRPSLFAGFMGALASQFWFLAVCAAERGAGAHSGADRDLIRAIRLARTFPPTARRARRRRHFVAGGGRGRRPQLCLTRARLHDQARRVGGPQDTHEACGDRVGAVGLHVEIARALLKDARHVVDARARAADLARLAEGRHIAPVIEHRNVGRVQNADAHILAFQGLAERHLERRHISPIGHLVHPHAARVLHAVGCDDQDLHRIGSDWIRRRRCRSELTTELMPSGKLGGAVAFLRTWPARLECSSAAATGWWSSPA